MRDPTQIVIENAREHNLQSISLSIPRNQIVVVTGVSGSGKSSLVYNTIYAEAQRRYLETLSPYSRQFIHLFQSPKVASLSGLSPAISLAQNQGLAATNSTVGTLSEIYDYLRLLYYSSSVTHCPQCGLPTTTPSTAEFVQTMSRSLTGKSVTIMSLMVNNRKGDHKAVFRILRKKGIRLVWIDGDSREISRVRDLDRHQKHTIAAVIDTFSNSEATLEDLSSALVKAIQVGRDELLIDVEGDCRTISVRNFCSSCGISVPEPVPASFSFNSSRHRCPHCEGKGLVLQVCPKNVFSDPEGPLGKMEAVHPDKTIRKALNQSWRRLLAELDVSPMTRWLDLDRRKQELLLTTSGPASPNDNPADILLAQASRGSSKTVADAAPQFLTPAACPSCQGSRLRKEAGRYFINGLSINQATILELPHLLKWITSSKSSSGDLPPQADSLLDKIEDRLECLIQFGLGYLNLNRSSSTLSGGELQRLRLASRIQQQMSGILYILDEPSIGLHPEDVHCLLKLLRRITEQNNSVLLVEHDPRTITESDSVIDLGPGGGRAGGRVVFSGTPAGLKKCPDSITGEYLSGRKSVPLPGKRRTITQAGIRLKQIDTNNLKVPDLFFPLQTFTVVTGVSGSGKSSLVTQTLYPVLNHHLNRRDPLPSTVAEFSIRGTIQHVCYLDQRPVGRTPRSIPATYIGIFDEIRGFFARLSESQTRGLRPGHFSFNTDKGRCQECLGLGYIRLEMRFLPDTEIICPGCNGKRYQREVLQVNYRSKTIFDILEMSIGEALEFFSPFSTIRRKLATLAALGLDYIHLGQSTASLSGGEQQRLKLATQLMTPPRGNTVYILDEPTTGLHFDEIQKLCRQLHTLVHSGHTVIAIEHNLDFIKQADYLVDLGPGSGLAGGEIVFQGPFEDILESTDSLTGRHLQKHLK